MAAPLGLLRRVPGRLQRPARSRFMSVFTPTELISQYSAKQPRGVRLKDMFEKGRQCSPAVLLQEARFLHSGGPAACAVARAAPRGAAVSHRAYDWSSAELPVRIARRVTELANLPYGAKPCRFADQLIDWSTVRAREGLSEKPPIQSARRECHGMRAIRLRGC
jgi:hypothetical protein